MDHCQIENVAENSSGSDPGGARGRGPLSQSCVLILLCASPPPLIPMGRARYVGGRPSLFTIPRPRKLQKKCTRWGAIGNPKNPSIEFYSGLRKKSSWGGTIINPKNPGIDFYSGFRKKAQGGGGAIRNPKNIQI